MFLFPALALFSLVSASSAAVAGENPPAIQYHQHNVQLLDIVNAFKSHDQLKALPFPPVLIRSILSDLLRSRDKDTGLMSMPIGPKFKVQVTKLSIDNEIVAVKFLLSEGEKQFPVSKMCSLLTELSNGRLNNYFYGPLLKSCEKDIVVEEDEGKVVFHPLIQGTLPSQTYSLMIWKQILSVHQRITSGRSWSITEDEIKFITRMCMDSGYDLLVRLMDPPRGLVGGVLLGKGSFGEVERVTWPQVGEVAIKNMTLDKFQFQPFIEEILAMRTMYGSPHFVNFLQVEMKAHNKVALTMEVLEGMTGRQIKEKKAIERMDILAAIIKQVLRGLQSLHARGYLHNDIKDDNIFITNDGQVKILDLGLATRIGRLFNLGQWKPGVPGFAPPEVYDPYVDNTVASDVWTVGTLFLTLFNDTKMELPDRAATISEDLQVTYGGEVEKALKLLKDGTALNFLNAIFCYNAEERASVTQLLEHPFIQNAASDEVFRDWIKSI